MIWKTIILLSIALCVLGDGHHAVSEQRIKIIHKEHKEHHGHHGELSHIGEKKPEHHEEYAWSYPSYEFSYKVHDPHTHDMKGQQESREGDAVKGEYWLIEPDGRKRTVTYHADKHSGFHAKVHYSDDHHHEDKKEEEVGQEGAGDEEGRGNEEGGEAQGGEEAGNEEAGAEEEGAGGGAEESRGREEEVGRWIHDRFWGQYGKDRHRDNKHRDSNRQRDGHKHDDRRDERRRDERLRDDHHIGRDDDRQRPEEVAKHITILDGLGSYGRKQGRERAEWHGHDAWRGKDERGEENRLRPQQRTFEDRSQPKYKMGATIRENYMHPRYYRHSQQRKN